MCDTLYPLCHIFNTIICINKCIRKYSSACLLSCIYNTYATENRKQGQPEHTLNTSLKWWLYFLKQKLYPKTKSQMWKSKRYMNLTASLFPDYKTLILFLLSYSEVDSLLCLGSLSCWITLCLSFNSQCDDLTFSFRNTAQLWISACTNYSDAHSCGFSTGVVSQSLTILNFNFKLIPQKDK